MEASGEVHRAAGEQEHLDLRPHVPVNDLVLVLVNENDSAAEPLDVVDARDKVTLRLEGKPSGERTSLRAWKRPSLGGRGPDPD